MFVSIKEKYVKSPSTYILVAVTSSGIVFRKQKVDVTFNFDKQDVVDFTKKLKLTMCRASVAKSGGPFSKICITRK